MDTLISVTFSTCDLECPRDARTANDNLLHDEEIDLKHTTFGLATSDGLPYASKIDAGELYPICAASPKVNMFVNLLMTKWKVDQS